jgi:site-specific DNA-methyltransferase (cytosine-N4-specific)
VTLHNGDALTVLSALPDGMADCVVTSPPYFGLRDYGIDGQYGLESNPADYVEKMRAVFAEARRVLAADGTLWLNLGDSYANPSSGGSQGTTGQRASRTFTATQSGGCTALPPKNLIGIPWRVAFALQDDGWTLRNAIVWHKPNAMPMSVQDRLNTVYEYVFLFSRSRRYYFDLDAIRDEPRLTPEDIAQRRLEPAAPNRLAAENGFTRAGRSRPISEVFGSFDEIKGRNPGDVWSVNTQPFPEAHFAVMPVTLAQRCIEAGCKPGGTVLDPFSGSGTTGAAAAKLGRRYVGIDLKAEYLDLSLRTRLAQGVLDFGEAS